jgi:uncharacterized protein YhbP (UPF0306 family)
MQKEILDFINSQRICVLAFEMLDGSPHASTVHFAFEDKSGTFFFETYNIYRKGEVLLKKDLVRASVVVGFDESKMKTLQLDGEARLIKSEEKAWYDGVYFGKFPEKKEKALDPKFLFFSFTPNWWRYTDWTHKDGKAIITSDDK